MPRFIVRVPEGKHAHLKIDAQPDDELTAEEAMVWVLNEVRLHLEGIEDRLGSMEMHLTNIAASMPG